MKEPEKKVYRSNNDYMIAGVAAGLAQYFNVDPVITRVIFILLTFSGGMGILIYFLLWLVIPREPGKIKKIDRDEKVKDFAKNIEEKTKVIVDEVREKNNIETGRRGSLMGTVLLLIGIVALWNQFMPMTIRWNFFWPLILVGIGLYFIFKR